MYISGAQGRWASPDQSRLIGVPKTSFWRVGCAGGAAGGVGGGDVCFLVFCRGGEGSKPGFSSVTVAVLVVFRARGWVGWVGGGTFG